VYNCTTNVPPTEGCNATSPSEVENVERSSCANYDNHISAKPIKGFESKTGDLMYHFPRGCESSHVPPLDPSRDSEIAGSRMLARAETQTWGIRGMPLDKGFKIILTYAARKSHLH
jgi:hypothetical protein